MARLRPIADFQYILPGAVGLSRGSNLYVWNPHIICGRNSMLNGHQSSVRGVTRVPGVDGAVSLRDDSRELRYRPGGQLCGIGAPEQCDHDDTGQKSWDGRGRKWWACYRLALDSDSLQRTEAQFRGTQASTMVPVSYTHLTLPTIYSV